MSHLSRPTSALSESEIEYSLHQIAQHNAQSTEQDYNGSSGTNAGPPPYQEPEPIGLGMNFTDYAYPDPQQHEGLSHDASYVYSDADTHALPTMHTPPTPRFSAGRSTRSGRHQMRTDSPLSSDTRVSKSTPKSKTKKKRPTSPSGPEHLMEVPFTLLDYDWGDVPLKAVNERAKWSREKRIAQSTKKDGGLGRPMNNFMLYRAAWADRCKHYFKITNHQKVSKILGHSWSLESPELKNEWSKLAKGESENHKVHLPEYKYQPAKSGHRKDDDGSDIEDYADDDPDGEYTPAGYRASQPRRQPPRAVQQPSVVHYAHDTYSNQGDMSTNAWEYHYPSSTQSIQYGQIQPYHGQHGQYFPAGLQQPWQQHSMDDMRLMNVTPAPSAHGLVGLPGGHGSDAAILSRTHTPLPQYQLQQVGGGFVYQSGAMYPQQSSHQEHDAGSVTNVGTISHFEDAIGDIGGGVGGHEGLSGDQWLDPSLIMPSNYAFDMGGEGLS